jgi:sterol desaturase/sphingolipid hydroxylase (fatty acid hydroxylase superfamily)
MMDYTLYLWHVLTHRVPFLWRFHAVHPIDLDLDASTALRFHFGELAVSVLYRAAQVVLVGVDTEALTCWQMFLSLSILFHYSNVRLPHNGSLSSWRSPLILLATTDLRVARVHYSPMPKQSWAMFAANSGIIATVSRILLFASS